MNELFCPKCGKKHFSANRYCQYCGKDLENVIIRFKQKNLPIKYQTKTSSIDEEKVKEIKKNISKYEKTEEELSKYDILPEKLIDQRLSSDYSRSMPIQEVDLHSNKPQKMKLKQKKDPWWYDCFCC